jgi:hypothetical protein
LKHDRSNKNKQTGIRDIETTAYVRFQTNVRKYILEGSVFTMKLLFATFLLSLFVATNGVDISHRASGRREASHSPLQGAMQTKNKSKKKISELEKAFAADQEAQKKERLEVAQQQKAIEELRRTLKLTVQREGKPGRDGRDGQQGPPGKDGRPGIKGESGRDGRDGATGPRGEPGAGIKGDKGDKGDDGLGLTLQPFQIGKTYKEGDYVFHTGRTGGDAMFIAQRSFKAASVPSKDHTNWLQFQAPRGRPGEKGEPGKAGANGEKGEPGKAGAERTGEPGRDGKDGATGPRGEPGTGIKGDKGDKGNDGLGLHLKVFEIGKSYTPGDYVFA